MDNEHVLQYTAFIGTVFQLAFHRWRYKCVRQITPNTGSWRGAPGRVKTCASPAPAVYPTCWYPTKLCSACARVLFSQVEMLPANSKVYASDEGAGWCDPFDPTSLGLMKYHLGLMKYPVLYKNIYCNIYAACLLSQKKYSFPSVSFGEKVIVL